MFGTTVYMYIRTTQTHTHTHTGTQSLSLFSFYHSFQHLCLLALFKTIIPLVFFSFIKDAFFWLCMQWQQVLCLQSPQSTGAGPVRIPSTITIYYSCWHGFINAHACIGMCAFLMISFFFQFQLKSIWHCNPCLEFLVCDTEARRMEWVVCTKYNQ